MTDTSISSPANPAGNPSGIELRRNSEDSVMTDAMLPIQFPKRGCPVCDSDISGTLFQQRFEQLSGARLLHGYTVVICEKCGAGYADCIPPQAAFDEYYRDSSKYDYADRGGAAPPGADDRFQAIATILERFIPSPDSRILEIGSASGQLLKVLKDRGFSNVEGADPSPGCVRAARELYGVPGFTGTVMSIAPPEKPYDVLILIGVMEHIRDVALAVDRFHALLQENGRVYLEVPDASRYVADLDAPFQEFSVEHINFFSPLSLTNLMHAHGFRVLSVGRTIRPQHEASCPATYGMFERSSDPPAVQRDVETETGLRAYIEGCRKEDVRIRALIETALQPDEKLIVWGVGAHTLRLLANGGLDPARIALFADSNPKYQQQELCGLAVVSPEELSNRTEPILISTRSFQKEILKQIREGLGLPNPVILLYGPGVDSE
jgi:SAM-dependent methyltransferase